MVPGRRGGVTSSPDPDTFTIPSLPKKTLAGPSAIIRNSVPRIPATAVRLRTFMSVCCPPSLTTEALNFPWVRVKLPSFFSLPTMKLVSSSSLLLAIVNLLPSASESSIHPFLPVLTQFPSSSDCPLFKLTYLMLSPTLKNTSPLVFDTVPTIAAKRRLGTRVKIVRRRTKRRISYPPEIDCQICQIILNKLKHALCQVMYFD